MDVIRIMLVDDHPALLTGLATLLNGLPDMEVVATLTDGQEAIDDYSTYRPDVVLMDLRMPDCGGVEAIMAICQQDPNARVIVVSTYDLDEDIYRALQSGARSYLLKDMAIEEIAEAIRAVYRGESPLPAGVAERLAEREKRQQLTQREREVLRALVRGRSNKEIASSLFISEQTVKSHLKALFLKMGVRDRTGAAIEAIRHGITHLD